MNYTLVITTIANRLLTNKTGDIFLHHLHHYF